MKFSHFRILRNKNDSKENAYSSIQHRNENNMTIASNNITTIDSSFIKIHPKPIEPTESSVKQVNIFNSVQGKKKFKSLNKFKILNF